MNKDLEILQKYSKYLIEDVDQDDIIKCSVIFEYLLAEILELSGNLCKDKGRVRLTSEMIEKAIENDPALDKLAKIY